jgi:hypothetical protein
MKWISIRPTLPKTKRYLWKDAANRVEECRFFLYHDFNLKCNGLWVGCPWCMLSIITYILYSHTPVEHRPSAFRFHQWQLLAWARSSPNDVFSHSVKIVRLQVALGRPRDLLPCGFHFICGHQIPADTTFWRSMLRIESSVSSSSWLWLGLTPMLICLCLSGGPMISGYHRPASRFLLLDLM